MDERYRGLRRNRSRRLSRSLRHEYDGERPVSIELQEGYAPDVDRRDLVRHAAIVLSSITAPARIHLLQVRPKCFERIQLLYRIGVDLDIELLLDQCCQRHG